METLFVSPGIRKNHKILNLAEENKVKITTDVEFFNEISNVKIIGVDTAKESVEKILELIS